MYAWFVENLPDNDNSLYIVVPLTDFLTAVSLVRSTSEIPQKVVWVDENKKRSFLLDFTAAAGK